MAQTVCNSCLFSKLVNLKSLSFSYTNMHRISCFSRLKYDKLRVHCGMWYIAVNLTELSLN